jgi:uncharacterized membrane protein
MHNFLSWVFAPWLVRFLYSFGSALVFCFTCWYFVYHRPQPDYNELLSVLIGAQVTVVTVMFSAVLVALQLGSAQFSPRITRSFFRYNPVSQSAFYAFLFGIMLCLSVKFTYLKDVGAFAFPWLAFGAVAYVFILMSIVLPSFVFHIADSINVASIVEQISKRTLRELRLLYGNSKWENGQELEYIAPNPPRPGIPYFAQESGFLDFIHQPGIQRIANKYPQWQFYVRPLVGSFIRQGECIVEVLPPAGSLVLVLPNDIIKWLNATFRISTFRSYEQDVLFGVRQLVDIAIKAISPAVNDPTTAVNCLYHIGIIIREVGVSSIPSLKIKNAPSNIVLKDFSFEMLCDLGLDQIYQWGHKDPVIVHQILETIRVAVEVIENPQYLGVLRKQVEDFELHKLSFDTKEQREKVAKRAALLTDLLNQRSPSLR